ncbi:MAG: amidohydrolase family protein [Candidatus Bipolaricaulota bacterium]|nr:amidohydrolase family protein [Candidatus Bipolaricaulota bacterium]
MYDLLIKDGTVMDGSGNPWFIADIAITGRRIERIGRLGKALARRVINASGLAVAPGFVDCHSHADFVLAHPKHPEILECFVRQGITTLITGNCGYSPFPVETAEDVALLKGYSGFFQCDGFEWHWKDAKGYMAHLEEQGIAYNVLPMTSHGTIRMAVKGLRAGVASDSEKKEMARLSRRDLEAGAWGLSAGLIYPPGMYSDTEELIATSAPLAEFHGVFTCHVRGSSETLLQAAREVVRIAEAHHITAVHSHAEAFGERFFPAIDRLIDLHDSARARGVDIGMDVIPYVAANTTLFAILPPWALEGGMADLAARLRDPETRERIRRSVEDDMPGWPSWLPGAWPHNLVGATGWENIRLISAIKPENKRYEGMSFVEIGAATGRTPFDAAADMIMEEKGPTMALYIGSSGIDEMDDPWHRKLVAHDQVAIETDAIVTGRGIPHPAAYGAFPKCLGRYSRDLNLVPMEEMVRKMTSLSLERFGVPDRGFVRAGAFADLVVFNPETIADNATYEEPKRYPTGIEVVIVNGVPVLENSHYSAALAGKVLRKERDT